MSLFTDFTRAISGFGSSGHRNSTPPTTQSSGFDQNGGEYTQHLGDADCSITFSKKKVGGLTREIIILDPSNNPSGTTTALTAAVMRASHKDTHESSVEYVKLSVTMRVLHTIYEGGMLQECGRVNPIHIEISSTSDDLGLIGVDGSSRTIEMIRADIYANIRVILAITLSGYDVSGKDGIYHVALSDKSVQKSIRDYRGIHTNKGSSHTDTIGVKAAVISIIEGRIDHYLLGLEKSTKNRTNSHQ